MSVTTSRLTPRAGGWYCQPPMETIGGTSDGDLARAIAQRTSGSAEAAESELYRRFAPRVRPFGLRHLRDEDAARDLDQLDRCFIRLADRERTVLLSTFYAERTAAELVETRD